MEVAFLFLIIPLAGHNTQTPTLYPIPLTHRIAATQKLPEGAKVEQLGWTSVWICTM